MPVIDVSLATVVSAPSDAAAWFRFGWDAQNAPAPKVAIAAYRRSIVLHPNFFEAHANLGSVLRDTDCFSEAAAAIAKAVVLKPEHLQAIVALGLGLHDASYFDHALRVYEWSAHLVPNLPMVDWFKSITFLTKGEFIRGWSGYEARWQYQTINPHREELQPWTPDSRHGARVLIHCEQGAGDSFQFARYLKYLKEKFALTIFLECSVSLAPVMANVPGVDQIVMTGTKVPDCDYQVPLMSLARFLWSDIGSYAQSVPYLPAPCQKRVNSVRPVVGLVWRGNKEHKNDHRRSINAELFARITREFPQYDFVSLQKDATAEEIAALGKELLGHFDYGNALTDFAVTAEIICNVDLLISVDTSVAHLAGALGRPVFVLIPYPPDWRWMHDRNDSIWYPTMRLFRRTPNNSWHQIIDQLVMALDAGIPAP